MAEGILERAVLEALAAAGLPTALVDGTAPFRVRWANAAFARSLRLGAAADGRPLLELLGGNNEGLATILRGLRDEGLSVVVGSRSRTRERERERELSLLPVPGPDREPAVLVLAHDVTEREETRRRLEAENLRLALFASVARRVASIEFVDPFHPNPRPPGSSSGSGPAARFPTRCSCTSASRPMPRT